MTRRNRKDLLEAIGFVALIASLVFVGIETRNSSRQAELNTQALEIAAYQELMSNIDDLNMLMVQSPATIDVMEGVWLDDFTNQEEFRRNRLLYILFRHGDLAYFMYERGAIDEERLLSALRPVPFYSEIGREFWARRKNNFSAGYQAYIDRLIDERPVD